MNPSDDDNANWQYKPSGGDTAGGQKQVGDPRNPKAQPPANSEADSSITWTASEYIHQERGAGWYLLLFAGTICLTTAVYFLTKDYFAAGTIVVLGIIVAVFAGHKPSQITYELTNSGIRVGDKTYTYNSFKSFAVMREGVLSSINLMPVKKFMPPVTAYFADADEEKITSKLGNHVPYEEREPDGVERLSRRLRF